MKFSLALFSAFVAGAAATKRVPAQGSIKADSALGQKLLSQARNLEENEDADGEQFQWVAGYSLKFQGCHHVQQWNADADDNEDVKVATKRLVRFRLCPSDTCSETKAAGCTGGYGDYIIDMNTYVEAYFEVKERITEQTCENFLAYNCDCEDDDGKGDDFNAEYCEYDCFINAEMEECVDRNPYEEEDEKEEFEVDRYMECAQFDGADDEEDEDRKRRKLEEGEEEAGLFIGPYCAEQGGAIYLGVFNDDTCSEFADDYGGKTTFKELTGENLPYSEESIVGMECLSCMEVNDGDDEDANDGDAVGEQCEQIYANAGKCEENLPSGMSDSVNTNGCTYIEGIKIVREDGILSVSKSRSNPVVTAFIVIFAMAFAAMGFYVWYLRQRLGVKKDTLM